MPPVKKRVQKACAYSLAGPIQHGFTVSDAHKRSWILGKPIGQGGFGCIYAARSHEEKHESYVAKIEPQENGPLFTEIHFYIRTCSANSIAQWMENHRLGFLGIPRYVSSGLCTPPNQKPCRFLIMDQYAGDLECALKHGEVNAAQLVAATIHVLNSLEYIHARDYAHADVKASNLLYKGNPQEVTLVDFGLVHLFRIRGVHCSDKPDPKFKHNGTLEFCSRDAHKGRPPSRRGDLEILAFNLIHWLARSYSSAPQLPTTGLPWGHLISDPKLRENVPERIRLQVAELKETAANNPSSLLSHVHIRESKNLLIFLQSVFKLGYDELPDYNGLRNNLLKLQQTISSSSADPVTKSSNSRSKKLAAKRSSTEKLPDAAEKKPHLEPFRKEVKRATRTPQKPASNRKPVPTIELEVDAQPISPKTSVKKNLIDKSLPSVTTKPKERPTRQTPKGRTEKSKQPKSVVKVCPKRTVNQNSKLSTPLSGDSEDEFDRLIRAGFQTVKSTHPKLPVGGGHKISVPLKSEPVMPALANSINSKATPTSSPSVVVRGRKSGCCQTSPELLLFAKAEAIRHRALRLKNQHF